MSEVLSDRFGWKAVTSLELVESDFCYPMALLQTSTGFVIRGPCPRHKAWQPARDIGLEGRELVAK